MSSVLVTGGAGYIGSHAVKALRAQGTHVVVFDNLSAGHREATSHASAVVVGDIHDTARIRAAIREHDVDAVMHFAAWLSVGESVRNPAGYYRNIVKTAWRWREAHPNGYRCPG
jgi:UDP-glucose 4-epimerase